MPKTVRLNRRVRTNPIDAIRTQAEAEGGERPMGSPVEEIEEVLSDPEVDEREPDVVWIEQESQDEEVIEEIIEEGPMETNDPDGTPIVQSGIYVVEVEDFVQEEVTLEAPPAKNTNYKCTSCGKPFLTRNQLTYHPRMCGKQKQLTRTQIPKRDSRSKGKPFKCIMCEQSFDSKILLNRHLLIHTGDYRYKCTFCKDRFFTVDDLNSHNMAKHTWQKSMGKWM